MRHTLAIFEELSIIRRGERGAYPGAKVTAIWELTTSAASTHPLAAGEVILDRTDAEMEALIAENDAQLTRRRGLLRWPDDR
jgi:hypothetical protein